MTIVLVAATGQVTNQMLSEQDLVDNVNAANLKWSGSAIAGSTKMVTYSEFTTYISNNGACGGSSNQLMPYSAMTACRVLLTQHSTGVAPSASTTYSCTWDDITQRGSCSQGTQTAWTYTAPAGTTVSTSSPIGLSLSGMSNGGSCSDSLEYTVELINPSGTEVWSGDFTSATMSTSYNASSATGAWKWEVLADDQSQSCGSSISGTGSYDDSASGTGTATVYY